VKEAFLFLDDVLKSPIEVDGLWLDATINYTIRRFSNGAYEIDASEKIGATYMNTPQYGLIEIVPPETLKDRFKNACDLVALMAASVTPEHKWNLIEEECAG
jgi:hypothetical protein